MNDDDRELRAMFARLRRQDHAHVPPFRIPAAHPVSLWAPPVKMAAAAAVVLVVVVLAVPDSGQRGPPDQLVDPSDAAWHSPTDFLLLTPGRELLRTMPPIGSPQGWAPIDLQDGSPASESTRTRRNPS